METDKLKNNILCNRKIEQELSSDLVSIKTYIDSKSSGISSTVHHFESSANNFIRRAIRNIRCSDSIYKHLLMVWGKDQSVTHVIEMNELYASRLRGVGSDAVFQANHIDGPFGFVPYLTLIRCIVTVCNETEVQTNLGGMIVKMGDGEFLPHDYNRDLHFIFGEQRDNEKRYVLKLHYVMYPDWMPLFLVDVFVWWNIAWNSMARRLFVFTLNPQTPVEVFLSWMVNGITILVAKMVSS
tara:strand:+ start:592 stop:1311 length:720 start_codon:yes stop_codon:yes gene_type:complete